jgi:hypothetical protein
MSGEATFADQLRVRAKLLLAGVVPVGAEYLAEIAAPPVA